MESLLAEHGYLGLFLGVLVFGYPVLLPAMYLAAQGSLSVAGLFALHLSVSLMSDSFWYGAGRMVPLERIRQWRLLRPMKPLLARLSSLGEGDLLRFLFASRFLYGAKLSVNAISGALRLGFLPFTLVNACSTAVLFWALMGLAYTAGEVFTLLMGQQARLQGALWALLVMGVALNLGLRRITRWRLERVQEHP